MSVVLAIVAGNAAWIALALWAHGADECRNGRGHYGWFLGALAALILAAICVRAI